jgi:hypothetical protein
MSMLNPSMSSIACWSSAFGNAKPVAIWAVKTAVRSASRSGAFGGTATYPIRMPGASSVFP